MSPSLGELAGALSTLGMLGLAVWAAIGKGRESTATKEAQIRAEREKQFTELEADYTRLETECKAVTLERDTLRRHQGTLLDFLRDVLADYHPIDMLKRRAADLLQRIAPNRGDP